MEALLQSGAQVNIPDNVSTTTINEKFTKYLVD